MLIFGNGHWSHKFYHLRNQIKNIFAFTIDDPSMPPNLIRSIGPGRGIRVEDIKYERRSRRVDYYLTESFIPRRVRSVAHYSLNA